MRKLLTFDNFMYGSMILLVISVLLIIYELMFQINTTDWATVINNIK